MMKLDSDQLNELGDALNEGTLLGAEVDKDLRLAALTVSVLTLPRSGPAPEDRRIQIALHPVGRVAASYRLGHWSDRGAEVVTFETELLLKIVESFKGEIYGGGFFDHDLDFDEWKDRLSLDYHSGCDGVSHFITLFQEQHDRHLDLRIWFDEIHLRDVAGEVLSLDELISGNERFWRGLDKGDPRTKYAGISLLRRE